MVKVEGSVFLSGPSNEPVWLPSFYIDVHPVSNADYARFVAATDHTPPQRWNDGQHPEGLADHPVVFVTWKDASAYAEWTGKALPTSQQWEKAARGTRGNVYPWGDQPTPAKCNVRENGVGSTTPVDRYQSGASPYGVYDMCGNVWEWCSTESKHGRYELKGAPGPAPSNAQRHHHSTMLRRACATTTPASVAPYQPMYWRNSSAAEARGCHCCHSQPARRPRRRAPPREGEEASGRAAPPWPALTRCRAARAARQRCGLPTGAVYARRSTGHRIGAGTPGAGNHAATRPTSARRPARRAGPAAPTPSVRQAQS